MRFFGPLRETLSLRDSPIGVGIPRAAGVIVAFLALAVTAADLHLLPWRTWSDEPFPWTRIAAAFAVLVPLALVVLARPGGLGDKLATLGLRRDVLPSVRFWIDATLAFAVIFAVLAGSMLVVYGVRHGLVWPTDHPPPSSQNLWWMLVEAPLFEELIYRWALVTALAALLPRWAAIAISSVAFGYLHVVYGTAAPNNLLAGFAFGWCYLKSGTIATPIAFHFLGNAAVHVANVATYAALT